MSVEITLENGKKLFDVYLSVIEDGREMDENWLCYADNNEESLDMCVAVSNGDTVDSMHATELTLEEWIDHDITFVTTDEIVEGPYLYGGGT